MESNVITRADVVQCYQLFLGRQPENNDVVNDVLSACTTLTQLRERFIRSSEFREKAQLPTSLPSQKPLDWPATHVQTVVDQSNLKKMFSHIEENWRLMGEREPHWSVLTNPSFTPDNIAKNKGTFYASGYKSVEYFKCALDRAGVTLPSGKICFELGCGVGRITLALADLFKNVVAADISYPHLKLASQAAQEHQKTNISFLHLKEIESLARMDEFDCFFSLIVLQHNPPPVIKYMLNQIFGKIRDGGLAYFQVPTYQLKYVFDADSYISKIDSTGKMEVHHLPQVEIFKLLDAHNFRILDIREDSWTGSSTIISNSFLVQKR